MTSANIPFLTQWNETKRITERSRSKRLYTFFHYEHSTHPRRFIISFFVIIFLTLAVAWLIAGLVRLRQTASYLESCSSGKGQCSSSAGLICSSTALICLCAEENYWDYSSKKCSTVKSINAICSRNDECATNKGLICYTNGTCQCPSNTYHTTSGCTTYKLFGASCTLSGTLPCNIQLDLVCDPGTLVCLCPSGTYWSSTRCEPVSTYGSYCEQNSSCNTQAGLFCRLPGPYPSCDCPQQSKLYTCDCYQGQTWVIASGVNGTSSCTSQGTYNGNCTSDSQCPQALHLVCINGACACKIPLWFWSSTSNECLPCESAGYILIQYSSQWVCTRLMNSSLMTYSASQMACIGIGWQLISPIFASDVTVIAQIYSTYRLWVNIQTSLGNSTYVNNVFPNNQSNWNTYISYSLASVYATYVYALQIVSTYDKTMLFEGNTAFDKGHALCALY
ncbi:unnamed protein product [Adineta ricciae]|uniref:EGF-like domain-containing protein n=1 Tax=Adineta ricciae TaxID=249248 RepID=A0A813QAR9_ADIRI|nr:unnamed protein product [Adineta ricciae]CAF1072228.1 unnamed protein product [Adineta ricciae]